MTEDAPKIRRGYIKAYFIGIAGTRIEVQFSFENEEELRRLTVHLMTDKNYDLHSPAATPPPMQLIPPTGSKEPTCPVHGTEKVYKNKKGGKHSHYCAVKVGEEKWCGKRIYAE